MTYSLRIALGIVGFTIAQPILGADPPAATVNGETIPISAVDALIRTRMPRARPLSAEGQRQLRREAVGMLVDDALYRQFLKANTPPVAPAEIDRHLAVLEISLGRRKQTLTEYLTATQQTREQLRASIGQMLQWNGYAEKSLRDADVCQYYDENKPYFDHATVNVRHIVIRVPANANTAERDAARQRLAALRAEIASGRVSFFDAATKNSQCPSATRGGELGFITRKWMVDEPIARAAFALEPKALSDIVTTDQGYHLIQVTERRAGEPSHFDDPQIQDAVRECLMEERKVSLMADLRARAKIEILLP